MAYRPPVFNLFCNIYTMAVPNTPAIPAGSPRVEHQPCQLTYGRRVQVVSTGGTAQAGVLVLTMNLLVPKGVDIRGPQDTVTADMVEVPEASGRWYAVAAVDDIGKGFANEHRTAAIFALAGSWVPPYP